MDANIVETEIGPEWDASLLSRLVKAVADLGGTMRPTLQGVGGSQEVAEYAIHVDGVMVLATAETYLGVRLRGPKPVVDRLVLKVGKNSGDA